MLRRLACAAPVRLTRLPADRGFRHPGSFTIFALVAAMTPASAQPAGHQHHDAGALPVLCAVCPAARESSGSSWQPDGSELHGLRWTFGDWQVSMHGEVTLVGTQESGPRGDDQTFFTNHLKVSAVRKLGAGTVGIRTMWSFEPAIGPRGYPLLLQNGETADGVNGLVDRQHPHDFPMELAGTYTRPTGADSAFFLYVAAAGEPAIGPPAYVHRASAAAIPVTPISHHWLDSTHISYGVMTAGYVPERRLKFEASLFRGREPDQHRWGFETPKLDSYALRASINPTPALALQFSAGHLTSPEQIHPGADVTRVTASGLFSRNLSDRLRLDATLAWGRNQRATALSTSGGVLHVLPGRVTQAVLAEGTFRALERHGIGVRFDHADKDELFPFGDPRHILSFPVTRLTLAYRLDLFTVSRGRVSLGTAVSWIGVPQAIEPDYGNEGASYLGYVRLGIH
jgi:hypothetical protein